MEVELALHLCLTRLAGSRLSVVKAGGVPRLRRSPPAARPLRCQTQSSPTVSDICALTDSGGLNVVDSAQPSWLHGTRGLFCRTTNQVSTTKLSPVSCPSQTMGRTLWAPRRGVPFRGAMAVVAVEKPCCILASIPPRNDSSRLLLHHDRFPGLLRRGGHFSGSARGLLGGERCECQCGGGPHGWATFGQGQGHFGAMVSLFVFHVIKCSLGRVLHTARESCAAPLPTQHTSTTPAPPLTLSNATCQKSCS